MRHLRTGGESVGEGVLRVTESPLIHLDLFSGIGGFALASEMVWEDVEHVFCDNDPFSQEILRKHWPNSLIYGDIKELTAERIITDTQDSRRKARGGDRIRDGKESAVRSSARSGETRIDLLTGGFPCQPFSQAGQRKGTEDDRHLWPEMLRVIRETNPTYIVGENVGGLLTWDGGLVFEQVCIDLEEAGYEIGAFVIPAASLNAPHRRDRVWIVAHASGGNAGGTPRRFRGTQGTQRLQERDEMGELGKPSEVHATDPRREHGGKRRDEGMGSSASERSAREPDSQRRNTDDTHPISEGLEGRKREDPEGHDGLSDRNGGDERWDWSQNWYEVATRFCRVDDGIPQRLDRSPRLKALGNAIVPQVAAEIMRALSTPHPLTSQI